MFGIISFGDWESLLGIDIGRQKGRDGYGSNERIFVARSQEVVIMIDMEIKIR